MRCNPLLHIFCCGFRVFARAAANNLITFFEMFVGYTYSVAGFALQELGVS
jgi:hypothetical protein